MMSQRGNVKQDMVVVAIDKDKGSQVALKWAVENLVGKGKTVTLLHVDPKPSNVPYIEDLAQVCKAPVDSQAKELFLPFRCFCTRKNIKVTEMVVEDTDIIRGLCNYVQNNLIETLVVGTSVKSTFVRRFKAADIPGNVAKGAPEFCTVYVISKGKVSVVRQASIPVPKEPPRLLKVTSTSPAPTDARFSQGNGIPAAGSSVERPLLAANATAMHQIESMRSPFTRGSNKSYGELSMATDISFVSSASSSSDRMTEQDMIMAPRLSNGSAPRLSNGSDTDSRLSFGSPYSNTRSSDSNNSFGVYSSSSLESGNFSWSGSQSLDEVEAEMRRLKMELKQTMDMYSSACKEALTAKQKALELHRWKVEEQQKLEEARVAEEAALVMVEKEKERCKAAIEKAEAAQRLAEFEAQKRMFAEKKALQESDEKTKMLDKLSQNDVRCRKYSIGEIEVATEYFAASRKIGEGGYGPVYKCYLDHTPVAIKVLRPDAAQGRSQFQQEVEVLSNIRHPNMVLLLGACPEYGCLVYEYMANGSLDDRLFRRGNSPVLPWQVRFRIAAEIATGLLFLHQTKPEPLVHRDLKPGNILLDGNYVSKISDVGLARLVPPSVADTVTQYRMTSTAGTFCYIDPEYQQSGMLGLKSDIYSLGVMLLQIITSKPPMGLTHHVERSIEKGTFAEMLDPAVPDWPVEEALGFAKLALQCAELRRKDRPDLGTVVLPELNRLRELGEESLATYAVKSTESHSFSSGEVQNVYSGPGNTSG